MGKGITEQQARAVELCVRATLIDVMQAMDLSADDMRLTMDYITPAELHGTVEIVYTPAPIPDARLLAPVPTQDLPAAVDAATPAAPAELSDPGNVLTVKDSPDNRDIPAEPGVDFFIEVPADAVPADAPTVAEVVAGVASGEIPLDVNGVSTVAVKGSEIESPIYDLDDKV